MRRREQEWDLRNGEGRCKSEGGQQGDNRAHHGDDGGRGWFFSIVSFSMAVAEHRVELTAWRVSRPRHLFEAPACNRSTRSGKQDRELLRAPLLVVCSPRSVHTLTTHEGER